MNILLIGNGFDLAHGLPTKYTDFLEWIVDQVYLYDYLNQQRAKITQNITRPRLVIPQNKKKKRGSQRVPHQKEIWKCIDDNIWIEYFLQCDIYQKENWIDFESEISNVIQQLDKEMNIVPLSGIKIGLNGIIKKLPNKILDELYFENYISAGKEKETTYEEVRQKLCKDLNKLIRALEIYICEYVEKIDINEKSPDIDKEEIDFILTFNYTNTFSKLYSVSSQSKKEITDPFDYIHGEAKINNTIETNNMVLGIDEYLPKKRRNKETEFIVFKKFYQRIYKQTGSEYKRWIEIIKNQIQEIDDKVKKQYPVQIPYNKIPNKYRNQLFVFGHSLDVTDGDVLRDLILNDNVHTTIFYVNKDVMGQQIANLVKVIGQDELIRRTGGSTKTIEFKQQQDMVNI